jgi:hypothetical protein
MKKILLLLSLTLAILSSVAQTDTIICYNGKFVSHSIDSNKFIKLLREDTKRCVRYAFNWSLDRSMESDNLKPENPNVSRNNDTLFLKLSNNTFKQLITDYHQNSDVEFEEYLFHDYIEELGLYIIQGSYYEYDDFIIVSRESGNLYHMPLQIAIYPKELVLLGANYDFEVGYYGNELDYYKIINGNLVKSWEISCDNVGFNEPILTKRGEVLFKKMEYMEDHNCCTMTYSAFLIIN